MKHRKLRVVSSLFFSLLISQGVSGQLRNIKLNFFIAPGNSFVSGQWKNLAANRTPEFQRNISPAISGGVFAEFKYNGNLSRTIIYDEMYGGGFFVGDNLYYGGGVVYSIAGQHYRKMKVGDNTWTHHLRLDYIKAPLFIKFIKGSEVYNQMIFKMGVYIGYLKYYKESNAAIMDNATVSTVAHGSSYVTTTTTTTPPLVVYEEYQLKSTPYKTLDFGAFIGVGYQRKLSDNLFIEYMIVAERGFADIKNFSSVYGNGTANYSYFTGLNAQFKHYTSLVDLQITLKKRFNWLRRSRGYLMTPE